jgi:signal transduction histidine kinase
LFRKELAELMYRRKNTFSNQGLGLVGMGERAALVNGEIEIESAIGKGTTVYVRVPASYEQAAT